MTGGSNIRAIGSEDAQDALETPSSGDEVTEVMAEEEYAEEYSDEWEDGSVSPSKTRWILPSFAVVAIACWTGFYGWAHQSELLAGGSPQQWTAWVTAWSVPTLLVVALWILASRNSRREAIRFGEVASSLSHESANLEDRLKTVNGELSVARDFIRAQSQDLESLGRVASQQISEHADRLEALILENDAQLKSIASVSGTALENMTRLRDDLPVIANSARDTSNQIGTAGETAHAQIAELVSGFERLNTFGQASESQVDSIQTKVTSALATFEAQIDEMERLTETRFEALRDQSETFRTELDGREVEALAAMRRRADELSEQFATSRDALEQDEEEALKSMRSRFASVKDEAAIVSQSVQDSEEKSLTIWQERIASLKQELVAAIGEVERIDAQAMASANKKLEALRKEAEAVDANIVNRDTAIFEQIDIRRKKIEENEARALAKLTISLTSLDKEISSRRDAQLSAAEDLTSHSETIAARIESLRDVMREVAEFSDTTQSAMAENANSIAENLARSREDIAGTDAAITELTEASVRLLELIQASSQHSKEDLPEAIGVAEERLAGAKESAFELGTIISEADEKSQELSNYVIAAQQTSKDSIGEIDSFRTRMEEADTATEQSLGTIRSELAAISGESELLTEKAQNQLRDSIRSLEEAARAAPDVLEESMTKRVSSLAQAIADQTGSMLDATLRDTAAASIAQLEEASEKSRKAAHETTVQLRNQLTKVNELAGNLESRVAHAREKAEEQVGNDFARRMALITESLNSNAIDISKAMSNDVTDTAWASYLRGDRGIFTRRAVQLLDSTEARDIAEIYDEEPDFRENVSRYIHDFEAMLRSVLSTRDGNALGVTLLSSDMGKLYVALAQSIERIRN